MQLYPKDSKFLWLFGMMLSLFGNDRNEIGKHESTTVQGTVFRENQIDAGKYNILFKTLQSACGNR